MKSILVILSQGPLAGQRFIEALSATLVLATFGHQVKVCLINDAVLLLQPPNTLLHQAFFKSTYAMFESFEFYDLLPVWVANHQIPKISTAIETQSIELNAQLLQQFDQVLYW